MSQAFAPRSVLVVKLVVLFVVGVLLGAFVVFARHSQTHEPGQGVHVAQPIPFSHKHHVGDVGLDCRFCHVTVEKQAFPGLPSAQLCLTCHSQLFKDQKMFAPLREAIASGKPIAWQRVHKLPDYVYFDHSVHLARGVACIECHGRMDQMPLTVREAPLTMRWCMGCHEDPQPHLRPLSQVFDPAPDRLSEQEVRDLSRLLQAETRRRLTDCSTCHR